MGGNMDGTETPNAHAEAPTPVPQTVTVFGERPFTGLRSSGWALTRSDWCSDAERQCGLTQRPTSTQGRTLARTRQAGGSSKGRSPRGTRPPDTLCLGGWLPELRAMDFWLWQPPNRVRRSSMGAARYQGPHGLLRRGPLCYWKRGLVPACTPSAAPASGRTGERWHSCASLHWVRSGRGLPPGI